MTRIEATSQIAEIMIRRFELHAELTAAPTVKKDRQWLADRVDEMAHLNRRLVALQAIAAPAAAVA